MSTPGTGITFPLRSGRLLVRPFEEADAPAAHAVYGDAEVMRFVGDGHPASLREIAEMIEGYRRHQVEHGFAFWAVLTADGGQLIGDAGLEVTEHGVELGYTLGRPWWGRGLATEAAGLCIDAALGPLGLTHLVALADARHPGSARVLEKVGFTAERRVSAYGRPHLRFVHAGSGAQPPSPESQTGPSGAQPRPTGSQTGPSGRESRPTGSEIELSGPGDPPGELSPRGVLSPPGW